MRPPAPPPGVPEGVVRVTEADPKGFLQDITHGPDHHVLADEPAGRRERALDLMKQHNHELEILFHAESETPLTCDLPAYVVLEVTYTEPGVKGDTTSATASKPATIETGTTINVPIFINEGEKKNEIEYLLVVELGDGN